MFKSFYRLAGATAVVSGLLGAVAQAASAPPPPVSTNGNPVQLVASGLKGPTSFAFGDGSVFEGDSGNSSSGPPNGGVYVLKDGAGVEIPASPLFVGGMTFHDGALYLSGAFLVNGAPSWQLDKWSGWNGTTFTKRTAIYTAPKKFQGFNGLAFGADGRIYVGVDTGLLDNNDHGPASLSPYLYDILSIGANGKGLKVFASGMRQPWQMAFPAGSNSPYVSDFGQDSGAKNPPDFLLRVAAGQNYGFPKCNWTKSAACKGFAKPFKQFSPHTDVGGVVIVGKRLYMSEFGFAPKLHPPAVVSLPLSGKGAAKTIVHFSTPVIALAAEGNWLYIGTVTGQVFRIKV